MVTRWEPLIDEASQRFGVPQDVIMSVMRVESGGRPGAVSPKGAAGLMQIMPDTYTELARKHNLGPDRFDPRNNIMGGTAYLRQMYDFAGGNWDDALAAYNAGPGRWQQQKRGEATLPAETVAYVPAVKSGMTSGQGGTNVPLFTSNRAATDEDTARWGNSGYGFGGLLEFGQDKNFYDGLGLLGNVGQTPSQPPRTDPAALPGTTQTDRMDLSGRINTLLEQYLQQPQKAMPSQLQYMLAGAQKGVAGLTGVHDRPVGIGEMLGALGGGVTSGGLAYDEAAQQRQGSELDRLLKAGAYQNQNRTAALNEANSIIENRLREAQTRKALREETDPKVVGKWIYENGQWKAPPGGAADGGPLEGTGYDAQMTNVYVTLSQKEASGQPLTPQETQMKQLAERHLMKPRLVTGPDGVVREVAPEPLPTIGGAGTGGPAPTPTPNQTPTPSPSRVTEVVPPTVKPTNEQNLNAGFANRMNSSLVTLNELEGKGWKGPGAVERNLSELPFGNYAMSPEYQQYDRAKRDFITAVLRRESGAAIGKDEYVNEDKKYFPQPGDDEKTLADKKAARELVLRNMAQSAGPAPLAFKLPDPAGGASSKLSDDEIKRKLGL